MYLRAGTKSLGRCIGGERDMFGAMFGDIVGSRFEFHNCRSKSFELFHPDCSFTDDTMMTLAVADALANAGGADEQTLTREAIRSMKAIAAKYPDAGWGVSFARWLNEENPQPYQSFGNGAAMRVSPVGWYARSEEEVRRLSRIVTAISHDHPEGLKGAECVAMCVYLARSGGTKKQLLALAREYYPEIGSYTCAQLSKSYRFDESCQGTVAQALTCFFEGTDFEDTIRNAVSVGGDTDTICAIAGSVAEAFFGMTNLQRLCVILCLPEDLTPIITKFREVFRR